MSGLPPDDSKQISCKTKKTVVFPPKIKWSCSKIERFQDVLGMFRKDMVSKSYYKFI